MDSNSCHLHVGMLARGGEHVVRRRPASVCINIVLFQQTSENGYQPVERKRRWTKQTVGHLFCLRHTLENDDTSRGESYLGRPVSRFRRAGSPPPSALFLVQPSPEHPQIRFGGVCRCQKGG